VSGLKGSQSFLHDVGMGPAPHGSEEDARDGFGRLIEGEMPAPINGPDALFLRLEEGSLRMGKNMLFYCPGIDSMIALTTLSLCHSVSLYLIIWAAFVSYGIGIFL